MTFRKVGDVIAEPDRNSGYSFGLEHAFLYGTIGHQSLVWNRHTGKVRYVTAPRKNENWHGFASIRAEKFAERLNARRAGFKSGHLPVDFAAIDSTP